LTGVANPFPVSDLYPTEGETMTTDAGRPDRIILVCDADSGLRAMLLDVVKRAPHRE
jgi:hypothetical protein